MKKTITLIALIYISTCLHAQNQPSEEPLDLKANAKSISASLHIGSLGVGIDGKYAISNKLNIRLGYTYLPINYNTVLSIGGINSNSNLKTNFSNIHLFGEYKVFKKSDFRLIGGLAYYTSAAINATFSPQNGYTVGTIYLTSEEIGKLKAEIDWKGIAPYIGLGFGKAFPKNKINVNFDLGTYYMPSPSCTVTGSERLADNKEIGNTIANNLSDYNWFPLLQINLNYKIK
jgi:hypothetical protein